MLATVVVGRVTGRVDASLQLLAGLALVAFSQWELTQFDFDITGWDVVRTGIVQGIGLGFLFVPLATVTFSTLPAHHRTEGSGLYSLVRNVGMSIGVSVGMAQLSSKLQAHHAGLAEFIEPFSFALRQAVASGAVDAGTPTGLSMLGAEVMRQAAMLAYLQDFRMMMWITLAAAPLVLLLGSGRPTGSRT